MCAITDKGKTKLQSQKAFKKEGIKMPRKSKRSHIPRDMGNWVFGCFTSKV